MVSIVSIVSGVVLVIAWFVSVGSGIELMTKHRVEGKDWVYYATHGAAWFQPDAFLPSGDTAKRRMGWGLVAFFAAAVVNALAGFLAG